MESLEDLIERCQRKFPPAPPPTFRERLRDAWESVEERSGELACYCFAAAIFFQAVALFLQGFVLAVRLQGGQ